MRFDVLTIFPELLSSPLKEGIIRRAQERDMAQIHCHDIRRFAVDKHHMVDDRPFGGGEGMVLKAEPLAACLQEVRAEDEDPGRVVLLSPRGRTLTQQKVSRLAAFSRLILVCGRYEGIDERFCAQYVDEEISIGDYILTGGELGAMIIIDSV
ncbi:MAG: tRNA (guanosine(37)-N1)-methyltransferase TrmD, partial [Desulfobulbaceae bacterium]|nr:tRNA (guanosine(37)-N1)-methyltransferase TrmD [Desulfobulbaceae bacterium]